MTSNDIPGGQRPQIYPTLQSADLRALIDFYVAAFGFTEVVAIPDADGRVMHAELAGPRGGGVTLGLEHNLLNAEHAQYAPHTLPAAPVCCYVVEPEVDALFARAVAAGAEVVREPHATPHGSRDRELRDPDGNHWLFGA
ncbi:VOC family protein [Streptosporangium roseum]|uniref:VOC family protein n=1 Tax=Streptosporangium roseum TaxID=2001 RepID=UPI00331769ED